MSFFTKLCEYCCSEIVTNAETYYYKSHIHETTCPLKVCRNFLIFGGVFASQIEDSQYFIHWLPLKNGENDIIENPRNNVIVSWGKGAIQHP